MTYQRGVEMGEKYKNHEDARIASAAALLERISRHTPHDQAEGDERAANVTALTGTIDSLLMDSYARDVSDVSDASDTHVDGPVAADSDSESSYADNESSYADSESSYADSESSYADSEFVRPSSGGAVKPRLTAVNVGLAALTVAAAFFQSFITS
jgi:hypothetical protein